MLSRIKIKGKTLDNWLNFYLSEPRVLAEAAGCKSNITLTLISQNRHVERHAYEILIVGIYSEFILAFQMQFRTYEAESEHFR